MEPSQPQSKSSLAVPIAIIVGFGLIAVAIFMTSNKQKDAVAIVPATNNDQVTEEIKIPVISGDDHVRGNPNAPIVLIEYSDYECPFCKEFHLTMSRIIDEYGASGQVAWVYRHYPLLGIHPNAGLIAQASECVAELGGNEAFWKFSDTLFDERESTEQTNMVRLPIYAEEAGVDRVAFQNCLDSQRHKASVEKDMKIGFDAGISGTPHTVVMIGDERAVIDGAESYQQVKLIVDNLIRQLEGEEIIDITEAEEATTE